jgi:hypothetical protein
MLPSAPKTVLYVHQIVRKALTDAQRKGRVLPYCGLGARNRLPSSAQHRNL